MIEFLPLVTVGGYIVYILTIDILNYLHTT
jgi:hypothetical protein